MVFEKLTHLNIFKDTQNMVFEIREYDKEFINC